MEKKHMHAQHNRLGNSGYLRNCRGSETRFHLSAILFFGVFSICLLIGLLVANVQYNDTKRRLTEDLKALTKTHSSTLTERKQLKNKLDEKSKELSMALSKQNSDSKCNSNEKLLNSLSERLLACNESLLSVTKERDQLNVRLIESAEEASGLQGLSEQNDSKCDLTDKNELSTLLDNLTACHQESDEKLSSISKEKDLLNAKLSEATKELLKLCHLFENTTCPDGWLKFNCSCYNIFGSGSWDEGRQDCISKGGDLVVINDPEEQNFLSTFKTDAWIGLSDREIEGSWMWVDGTALNFTFWNSQFDDKGDGNPEPGEDCAHIMHNGTTWNDLSCDASLEWICEKIPTMFTP